MPTVGELTIILEAQDRASAQLREVGQGVQRLERQVESAGRSTRGLSGVFGQLRQGLGQGLSLGAGFGAIQAGVAGLQRVWDLLSDSIVGANSRLEQQRGALRALTGSAAEAERILTTLRREADVTPFDTEEMIQAGAALTAVARNAQVDLMELVRTAEILAAYQPTQGLEGAAVAIREAFEGNFQSLTERFGVTGAAIRRFQAQGLSTFAAINAAMAEMGLNSRLIQELANTFPGLTSNVVSFFNEFRRRLGEGVFVRLEDGLRALTGAIARNGEAVLEWASGVGSAIGALVGRVGSMLGELAVRFLNWLDPGLGDQIRDLFSGVADSVQQTGDAADRSTPQVQQLDRALTLPEAQQALQAAGRNLDALRNLASDTAGPVAAISRELGQIGVAAGEIQIGADRIRRGFEEQIRPLERQLDLLQNSAEVQRLQAGLASNRALTERLRLQAELNALERAGAAADPDDPNLTPRQRAIALAAQERRLQLQALDLDQQRGPAIQSLQERIADLRRREQDALDPSERLLASYKDRVDVLNVERQRWENLKADIQAAVDFATANPIRPEIAPPDTSQVAQRQAEYREAGEKLADKLLEGWQTWVDSKATAAWDTIAASYWRWWGGGGASQVAQMGDELGGTLARFAVAAFESRLGAFIGRGLVGIGQGLVGGPLTPSEVGGSVAAGLPGGPLPTVSAPLSNPGAPGATSITVTVGDVVAGDPGLQERLKQGLTQWLRAFMEAAANVEPGSRSPLPGATR